MKRFAIARSTLLLAVVIPGGMSLAAPAVAKDRPTYEREYLANYAELRDRHGVRSPGCNLVTDKYNNRCEGKATKADVVESNRHLENMLYVPPPPLPPSAPVAHLAPQTGNASGSTAPSYSGVGGTYCGLFQFDKGTWESVGGSGSPCEASEAEQWSRAQELQRQRGNQPWPVCGQDNATLEQIVQCESNGNPRAVGGD